MELKENLNKSLKELRKDKERKFVQTVDLIINLHKIEMRKVSLNLLLTLPHKVKDKKIAGFLETKNKDIKTITPAEFGDYSDKKTMKKLVDEYDFFIAQASVMPKVATKFGRFLGPTGKMPSPQLGIIMNAGDKDIREIKEKINTSIKIRPKEPSIKVAIGKQDMEDKDIVENILTVYNSLLKKLPRGKDNVKNIEIKFTMTKPQKIKI
jgi:large subunit ribosomal protein L1